MKRADIYRLDERGPFRAHQLHAGDPYELSRGHSLQCLPSGGRVSRAILLGASVLETDPAVTPVGVGTGFSPEPGTLRAPNIAVGNVPDAPGWVAGAPHLAVEYADVGHDEEKLHHKIADLLGAGTRFVWVVRLVGPRRVEVYEPDGTVRTVLPGQELTAPDALRNAVPVEALYDREAAYEAMLRNLLQRKGFESLEALREERRQVGHQEGRVLQARDSLRRVLFRRGFALSADQEARIDACADLATLARWHDEAVTAASAAAVFGW